MHTLLDGEMTAGAGDNFLGGGGFKELEAVAKCVSLLNQRVDFNFAQGQIEFQANHLSDRNFGP